MSLADKFAASSKVTFKLSPEGRTALGDTFDKPSFQAEVEDADELGVWIWIGQRTSLLLLKWDYFATAVVDYEAPEQSVERGRAGFIS
jgi:hypothetical protein